MPPGRAGAAQARGRAMAGVSNQMLRVTMSLPYGSLAF